jgi:uncharacterized protein YjeT (DUF2065 family)
VTTLAADMLIGIAFFLIVEGLVYALAPRLVKLIAAQIPAMSEEKLRIFGVVTLAAGVCLVWLVRG